MRDPISSWKFEYQIGDVPQLHQVCQTNVTSLSISGTVLSGRFLERNAASNRRLNSIGLLS